jgi:hypothetical protein
MSRRSTTSTPLRMELRARRADRSGRSNDGLPPGAYYMCSDSEHSSAGSALPRTAESPTRSDETTNRRHANRVLTAALARNSQRQTPVPAHDTRSASTSSRKADVDADVENPTKVLRSTGRRQPSRRRRRSRFSPTGVTTSSAPTWSLVVRSGHDLDVGLAVPRWCSRTNAATRWSPTECLLKRLVPLREARLSRRPGMRPHQWIQRLPRRHCDGAPPGGGTTKAIARRRQPTARDGRWEKSALGAAGSRLHAGAQARLVTGPD